MRFDSKTDTLRDDPAALAVRKRELTLAVRFAEAREIVETLEGPVPAQAGDAIVAGVQGEQWPIAREHFATRYIPVAPLPMFASGAYSTIATTALARQFDTAFTVVLADGSTTLQGAPGDWLLDYGGGKLGVVHQAVFSASYEPDAKAGPRRWLPPLHVLIKRVLLAGLPRHAGAGVREVPPASMRELIDACRFTHHRADVRAVEYGHRYRSAFWSIYLLSALTILFSCLSLVLASYRGSDALYALAKVCSAGEVLPIAIVLVIYWRGNREKWQEQWLAARTCAELAWYLPLVAPLVDFEREDDTVNWYDRVFNPGAHLQALSEIDLLCARLAPQARALQARLWTDPEQVAEYARWTTEVLEGQRRYHQAVRHEQHHLIQRVHRITTILFALTALGAALSLVVHSVWMTLVTIFFPALGAALHGALVQSEASRIEQASTRLDYKIEQAVQAFGATSTQPEEVADWVQSSIAVLLDEHQDWHGTVRPHHIPLA